MKGGRRVRTKHYVCAGPAPHISLLFDHQNGQKIGIMMTQAIQEMTHIGTPTLT